MFIGKFFEALQSYPVSRTVIASKNWAFICIP